MPLAPRPRPAVLSLSASVRRITSLSHRAFGVAINVDLTATADDWATYRHDWNEPKTP